MGQKPAVTPLGDGSAQPSMLELGPELTTPQPGDVPGRFHRNGTTCAGALTLPRTRVKPIDDGLPRPR